MDYKMLWFKINHKIVTTQDYIDWALVEINNGKQAVELYAIASYTSSACTELIQKAFDSYSKCMPEPSHFAQLASYIDGQIKDIQQDDGWEQAIQQLKKVWLHYGQPSPLAIWYELATMLTELTTQDILEKEQIYQRAFEEAYAYRSLYCFTRSTLWKS